MTILPHPLLCYAAGECWGGRAAVLQREGVVPKPGGADAVGAPPPRPKLPAAIPHQPGAAAGVLYGGKERVHRDQVPLTAAA